MLWDWICMQLITYFYLKGFQVGCFDVTFPDGTQVLYGDTSSTFKGVIVVHSMRAFSRMVTRETLGMADAYMSGEWDSPDLARMVEVVAENVKARAPVGPPFQAATAQLEGFMRWVYGFVAYPRRPAPPAPPLLLCLLGQQHDQYSVVRCAAGTIRCRV